ncbi:MAG: hypothetical protein WC763_00720 [Candidatus Paceibacterota bacterium]|jgi:hypothetical protein
MKDNTRNGIMLIKEAPTGPAPLEIRRLWIGVRIPFIEVGRRSDTPNGMVFTVDQEVAIRELMKSSLEAAGWWRRQGYPMPEGLFTFNAGCADIVLDS